MTSLERVVRSTPCFSLGAYCQQRTNRIGYRMVQYFAVLLQCRRGIAASADSRYRSLCDELVGGEWSRSRHMLFVVCFLECRAFLYIVVQSVGAIAGAGILKGLTLTAPSSVDVVCTPKPSNGYLLAQTFGIEMFITMVLVLTVFATCDSNRSGIGGSGPLAIGLSISMCHLWAVSLYNTSQYEYMSYVTRIRCYNLQHCSHTSACTKNGEWLAFVLHCI